MEAAAPILRHAPGPQAGPAFVGRLPMTTTEPRTIASVAEAIERARALLPAIRERARTAEELRQLPQETVQDLKDSGLLRIPTPPRYGGYALDIDAMFQVGMELGRACGSTAWCSNVWGIHNWMVGHWPEEAQDEYFSTGPPPARQRHASPAVGVCDTGG